MKLKYKISKEFLRKYYVIQFLTQKKIAELIGCNPWVIRNRLIKFNIKRRTTGEVLSEKYKDKGNPNWQGGLPNCLNCGKILSSRKCKYCNNCKFKILGSPNLKHGKTINNKCIDCGKDISWRSIRCPKCAKIGKLSPFWKKDKANDYYPNEFRKVKSIIRKRDDCTCQKCNKRFDKLSSILGVHHIDYDKLNNVLKNLISLCRKCNAIVNYNRDYWYAYFMYLMENYIVPKFEKACLK